MGPRPKYWTPSWFGQAVADQLLEVAHVDDGQKGREEMHEVAFRSFGRSPLAEGRYAAAVSKGAVLVVDPHILTVPGVLVDCVLILCSCTWFELRHAWACVCRLGCLWCRVVASPVWGARPVV